MKKILVIVVLLLSLTLVAAETSEDTDNCAGFFDSIKCFLWGDS